MMNKLIIFVMILGLLAIGVGAYFATIKPKQDQNQRLTTNQNTDITSNSGKYGINEAEIEDTDSTNEAMSDTEKGMDPGSFVEYNSDLLQNAKDGKVVVFFHAKWCPTCRALELDINNHLDDIPADLTILKTDYDTETALKKKYGITVQHSLVQVDADGNELKQWVGSPTLDKLEEELI